MFRYVQVQQLFASSLYVRTGALMAGSRATRAQSATAY